MNTANLQLEGLYAVAAAVLLSLEEKGIFSPGELEALLARVEVDLLRDTHRPAEMRGANVDAICFPARLLRQALRASAEGRGGSFSELAGRVGKEKDAAEPKA